ncbi:MAG: hypothetical protein A07HR60_00361 [uncultured archaeon A07HR60]|nr:MAG: hypothetical protein A07HR60_00361 [uncultured archaeon A07HR60]
MVPEWFPASELGIILAFVLGFGVVYGLERPDGDWSRHLRSRLLLGLPWGTLISVGFVVFVYLFVQQGIQDLSNPVVLPFRAWSYFHLGGVVWAGFSHASYGHLIGNLLGALVAGSLAEYAWGHFPQSRGTGSFESAWTNPYARAFVVAPGFVLTTGLLTAVFSIGPVIGFSGVVFAMWGFALVQYPLGTVVALVGSRLVGLVWQAFQTPVLEASAGPSFTSPWWAGIAIQGHAIGLFVGVVAGLLILQGRDRRPGALRIFAGVLLFAVSRSLWAVYWFRGGETYVLFRAVGVGLIVILAALIAAAVAAPGRPLFGSLVSRVTRPSRLTSDPESAVSLRAVAFVLLLVGAAAIAGPAIPVNLQTTADDPLPGEPLEVEGYEVTYAENIQNGMVSAIEVEAFGESTAVNTSGVIVRDTDRHLWATAITRSRLAFRGESTVEVGGIGWRETVDVQRQGWTAAGGDVTYHVSLAHDDKQQTAFLSAPATAEPTIDGRNVTIAAVAGGFRLRVHHANKTVSAPLPAQNQSVRVGGLTISRQESNLFAQRNDTTVRVATAETYE